MWWVLLLQAVAIGAIVLYLYNVYASYQKCARLSLVHHPLMTARRPWYVTAAVLLGWYASFSLVILIPTDVASVRFLRVEPALSHHLIDAARGLRSYAKRNQSTLRRAVALRGRECAQGIVGDIVLDHLYHLLVRSTTLRDRR